MFEQSFKCFSENKKGDAAMSEAVPHCAQHHSHQLQTQMPPAETLYELAEFYKVFGDCTRIKILYLLFESEKCVCDLAELLGVTVSAVSHQLKILKQVKLVKFRREGKTVWYSLADDHVRTILGQGLEHIAE